MTLSRPIANLDEEYLNAIDLHDRGRIEDAEQLYRSILRSEPRHFGAAYSLGVVFLSRGNYEEAEQQLAQAVLIEPRNPLAQINRGVALKNLGRLEESLGCADEAIALYPQFALAHYNRGNTLRELGRSEEAVASYERAIALKPDYAEAVNNRGNALGELKRFDEAAASYERAIALKPDYAEAFNNRGNALGELKRFEEAVASYDRAIALKPNYTEAFRSRGDALDELKRFVEAVASYDRAIALKPDDADSLSNRGNSLRSLRRFADAVASYDRALALNPDLATALNNRGAVLQDLARVDEAVVSYRRALEVKPDFAGAHSNLLFALNYQDGTAPEDVFADHLAWPARHERGAQKRIIADSALDPERVLRVGYVSGDLRTHSVAYFFEPLLEARDRTAFHVTCYANGIEDDATTKRMRALSDAWRTIAAMSDDEAERQIRDDGIDILVDLSGHTARNRLTLFAGRAAPIQVTYLGYPNTTGLSRMDYRFTDAWADPVGQSEAFHTETLVRLDGGFLCYRPPDDSPPVAEAPVCATGRLTFGSFNSLTKVNAALIARWSAILTGVPGSRLILKASPLSEHQARSFIRTLFARHGIAPERLELSGWSEDRRSHLARYGEVDIALDTFPYNGTATTCEALWMGVPVVTLAGRVHASRVGMSLLSRIGLGDLVATSMENYVKNAIDLAHDVPRLQDLRRELRPRMGDGALTDSVRIARDVESAYRAMWRRHCTGAATEAHERPFKESQPDDQ